jgi:V/A-type H+-transporting ATPase subunit D
MSMDSLAPTRMNLLARKAQIKLASDGVQLLKGKRDALLQELISRARQLRTMRNELHARGRAAGASMAIARALRGTPDLRSAAMAGRRDLHMQVKTDKVWGLPLGKVELQNIVRTPNQRAMGQLDTSAHVHEASSLSEGMLEQLLQCAPLERNLQIIGEEVKKVSRRINALEEYLLPKLRFEMRAIARVLDEREREDTFRLKRIKSKKAAQKRAKAHAEIPVGTSRASEG